MPPRRRFVVLIGLIGGVFAAAPATAAVEIDGTVFAHAAAQFPGLEPNTQTKSAGWSAAADGGGAHDLSAHVEADQFVHGPGALDSVEATSDIDAHWNSADRGTVSVPTHEWVITAEDVSDGQATLNTPASGQPDWAYSFTATHDGAFDLSFELFGSSEDAGLGTWDFLISQDGGPASLVHLSHDFGGADAHVTGAISELLAAGHSYSVALVSNESVDVAHTAPTIVGSENVHFDWRISGDVPEPSTWTLATAGFGLAGVSLRRRRPAAAG
jgi:hypothetical protein